MSIISKCCWIDNSVLPIGSVFCEMPAQWVLVHGAGPDDYTESCTKHLGDMMTDAPEHRIYALRAAIERPESEADRV